MSPWGDRHSLPHQETGEAHYDGDGCPAALLVISRDETYEVQTFGGVTKTILAKALRLIADELDDETKASRG